MHSREILKFRKDEDVCNNCSICSAIIRCPGGGTCIGCGACYRACPSKAFLKTSKTSIKEVKIMINSQRFTVPKQSTVKEAIIRAGYKFTKDPSEFFAPCLTGGCYACAVIVEWQLKPTQSLS